MNSLALSLQPTRTAIATATAATEDLPVPTTKSRVSLAVIFAATFISMNAAGPATRTDTPTTIKAVPLAASDQAEARQTSQLTILEHIRQLALGPTPVADKTLSDAEQFARTLPPENIALPRVTVADDDELNFMWKIDGHHIDLGFYGDGTYSYYARQSDGKEFSGDDVPASNPLPIQVLALVRLIEQV